VKYDRERPEMLEFIPASARRILDVGCSTGRFGTALRASRLDLDALWGVDPTPDLGREGPYDVRIAGSFPQDIPVGAMFDCVIFNDVLEHMVDPWDALERTRSFLAPGGVVVVSMPNVRHVSVVQPLLMSGRWDYCDEGILDRTHLRFFTRATAIELLESTGYSVEMVQPIRWSGARIARWLVRLNRLLRGRLDDFFPQQYALVARAR
jgi:SAM-dependent methyltransferase